MNINKRLKPNLIDPIMEQKIIKTLKPPDYWAPTKNVFNEFYKDYIRPNMVLIIIIIFICMLLFYRYWTIKNERINEPPKKAQPILQYPTLNKSQSDLLLEYYYKQKEASLEPKPVKSMQLAYPLYPYSKGGTLAK